MTPSPVDTLLARIDELERLFAALRADPVAWREVERHLAAMCAPVPGPAAAPAKPAPRAFIRGGFGEEMDAACAAIADYFVALPGWRSEDVHPDEVINLAGFFAFIALASSPVAPLELREAAVGARATVARILLMRRDTPAQLTERLSAFKARLARYSALWAAVLKGEKTFGAFASYAFEKLRTGGRTLDGYVEHLNAFPGFYEARIKAFHEATAPAPEAREAGTEEAD
jgi:hypothetical protein